VKASEFLRKVKRIAREEGRDFRWDPSLGKGSHGTVHVGQHSTTLKDLQKELGPGLLRSMCKDLQIDIQKL
jgi:mRNA interferase HicA